MTKTNHQKPIKNGVRDQLLLNVWADQLEMKNCSRSARGTWARLGQKEGIKKSNRLEKVIPNHGDVNAGRTRKRPLGETKIAATPTTINGKGTNFGNRKENPRGKTSGQFWAILTG